MQYKVNIDFSYELESEKEHDELLKHLEQELNNITKGIVLNRRQIRLKKLKEVKNKIRLAIFKPEDILQDVNEENKRQEFVIDGIAYSVRMDSSRYFVFKDNAKCVACEIEGTEMILEMNPNDKAPHFNLYAKENGKLILLTKDHILARSKAGTNEIENYQTLCCICNNLKGNDDFTNNQLLQLRMLYNDNKNLPRKLLARLMKEAKEIFKGGINEEDKKC